MFNVVRTLTIAASLFVTSCGGGKPSESDGRNVYLNKRYINYGAAHIAEGKARLVSFEKINGKMVNAFGHELYIMEARATIECLDNLISRFESCKKGERASYVMEIEFEKTERGWKGEDGEIY